MLSAVIPSSSYPAAAVGTTTGKPEVRPHRSSVLEVEPQTSNACADRDRTVS